MIRLPGQLGKLIGVDQLQRTGAPVQAQRAQMDGGGFTTGTVHLPGGPMAGVKAALQNELAALQHEARSLESKLSEVERTLNEGREEINRLGGVKKDLEAARGKALDEVRDAKKTRRAAFDEAKALVDGQVAALKEIAGPDAAEALEAGRKKLLGKLARAALKAGNTGKPPATDWVSAELEGLRKLALPEGASAEAKKSVEEAIATLSSRITDTASEIATQQRGVSKRRNVFQACDRQEQKVASRIDKRSKAVQESEKQLEEIKPRLTKLKARIQQVQAAITLIDTVVQMLKTRDELKEKEHQRKMDEVAVERQQERLRELERASTQLEETLRQTRIEAERAQHQEQEKKGPAERQSQLSTAIGAARAKLATDQAPELVAALALLDRLLDAEARAEDAQQP